jgi:tetratricopeptide (TPR) repeat protein
VSRENKPDEKELWKSIPSTQGADRAETYVQLSHLAYDRGDHKAALALCQSAREIYEGLTDFVGTTKMLHVFEGITWSLRRLDRDEEAAYVALDAVTLLKEDDPAAATEMFRDAGRFFYAAGEFQKSLDCHQLALGDVDPELSDITIGVDYFNCGSSLVRLDQDAEAMPYLVTAREYFKKAKEPERVYCTDEFLTIAYTALENGVEAITYAQKSLDFAITAQNKYYETWAHYRLGRAQVLMGELEDAEEHLRTAISMNTSSCHPDWDLALDAETEVADIYTTQGRTEEAEEIMRRLKTLEEIMDSDEDKK